MSEKQKARLLETRNVTRNGVTLQIDLKKGNKRNNWQLRVTEGNLDGVVEFFGDEAHLVIGSSLKHWLNIIQGREGAEYLLKRLEGDGKFFGRDEGSSGPSKKELNSKIDSMRELLKSKGMTDEEIDAYLSTPKAPETTAPETTAEVDNEDELDAETAEDIAEDAEETEEERELAIA